MEISRLLSRRSAVGALLALPSGLFALDTRESAPKFFAKTLDGDRYDSGSLKGRIVLIQFWATWCRYCRRDQEAVDTITHEFKDVLVLAVNMGESKGKVKRYLKDSPRSCKIVLGGDTNLAAMFAAKTYPLYVLIDQQGKIAGEQRGAGGEAALRRLLRRAGLS